MYFNDLMNDLMNLESRLHQSKDWFSAMLGTKNRHEQKIYIQYNNKTQFKHNTRNKHTIQ